MYAGRAWQLLRLQFEKWNPNLADNRFGEHAGYFILIFLFYYRLEKFRLNSYLTIEPHTNQCVFDLGGVSTDSIIFNFFRVNWGWDENSGILNRLAPDISVELLKNLLHFHEKLWLQKCKYYVPSLYKNGGLRHKKIDHEQTRKISAIIIRTAYLSHIKL